MISAVEGNGESGCVENAHGITENDEVVSMVDECFFDRIYKIYRIVETRIVQWW